MANRAAELQMIERHIVQGERHVIQQEELISRLRQRGLPTAKAEQLLATFRATLHEHWRHRSDVLERLQDPS